MKAHSFFATIASASTALAASLQAVRNFGANPTNIQMYFYVPDKLAAKPAVVVGLHPCGGSATSWFSKSLAAAADTNGFILIYPGTTRFQNCWDVNNLGSLSHGGVGDATGIVNAVKYALETHNGDATRVFAFGGSSGAMMTNVLAGSYPDVFAGGAVYSGVPFGCLYGSTTEPSPRGANQSCAQGQVQHTAEQWASFVRNAYPGYDGPRPKMLIWHGSVDTLVKPQTFDEQMKQWSAVLDVAPSKAASRLPGVPGQYTEHLYGDGTKLIGYMGNGVPHFVATQDTPMLKFFGLT